MHTSQLTFPCSMLIERLLARLWNSHYCLGFLALCEVVHPGSGLIDCTSEGNKLAFDLVERQGQMWCGSKDFSAVSHAACFQVSWKAAWELEAKGSWGH